jgi:zinc transport system substrate-binding protein
VATGKLVGGAVLLLLTAGGPLAARADEPRVVATIPAVHDLTAAVMEGRGEPVLLVRGNASPHGYQLRPSDAQALQRARLVVRIGPALETFLEAPLANRRDGLEVITLMEAPGVKLLPARHGGVWAAGYDDVEEEDRHDAAHDHGPNDPHIWLSPINAQAMVRAIATALAKIDPGQAALYEANAERAATRLAELDAALRAELAPVSDRPFVVFHDAYQYLEHEYGLRAVGAITVSPDRPPSAQRLGELAQRIRESGAVCVFGESQTRSPLAESLARDLRLGLAELDPEGRGSGTVGLDGYVEIMRRNAGAILGCLAQRS